LNLTDWAFTELKKLPTAASAGLFASASSRSSFATALVSTVPSAFVGTLTPALERKFRAPLRRRAFVPNTAPISPTRPKETAPRIIPKELLSAAAAAAAPVALNEADALAFANKFGMGVPERLIVLIEDGEKEPPTDIDRERVGLIVTLFVIDEVGVAVLPGDGEIVAVIDAEADCVCDILVLNETEELGVCVACPENDGEGLDDAEVDRVCVSLAENDGVPLTAAVTDGVIEAIIHV